MGLVSSLGRDVATACAAARAGLSRPAELKSLSFQLRAEFGKETIDGFPPVVGHSVPGIGAGFVGPARTVLLASAALDDLLAHGPLTGADLLRTGVHLNLSDFFIQDMAVEREHQSAGGGTEPPPRPSQVWKQESQNLLPKILARCGLSIPAENQALYHGGHTGLVQALDEALIKLKSGRLDQCLVGAVESCIEPHFLEAAAAMEVLKTGDNPAGFMPGEAAGFLLLERVASGGPAVQGLVVGTALAKDPCHQFSENPPLGRALEQAVKGALGKDGANERPAWVLGDLNGTERRALDWAYALLQIQGDYPLGELALWLPAVSFGETGAATGVLSICLIGRAFVRGYAPGDRALVCLASDNGNRGAILLRSPQH